MPSEIRQRREISAGIPGIDVQLIKITSGQNNVRTEMQITKRMTVDRGLRNLNGQIRLTGRLDVIGHRAMTGLGRGQDRISAAGPGQGFVMIVMRKKGAGCQTVYIQVKQVFRLKHQFKAKDNK